MAFETSLVNLQTINFSNFFETTLKTQVTDGTDTNIYLTALPTDDDGTGITEGFLTLEPTSATKREIIYFNAVGADYVTVPSAANGRGVGGTTAQGHSASAVVRLANPAEVLRLYRDKINDLRTGWDLVSATGTRVDGTSFTLVGNKTDLIAVGDKVKYTDTTTKYGYVTAVAYTSVTTVTITGGSDYTLEDDPSNIYFSKASSPVGFPDDFAFNGSPVGWASFIEQVTRFYIKGKQCYLRVALNGVSNSTTTTLTAPIAARNGSFAYYKSGSMTGTNNGVGLSNVYCYIAKNTSTVTITKDGVGSAFDATNQKAAWFNLDYEI